jgi:hypothetical protein
MLFLSVECRLERVRVFLGLSSHSIETKTKSHDTAISHPHDAFDALSLASVFGSLGSLVL